MGRRRGQWTGSLWLLCWLRSVKRGFLADRCCWWTGKSLEKKKQNQFIYDDDDYESMLPIPPPFFFESSEVGTSGHGWGGMSGYLLSASYQMLIL